MNRWKRLIAVTLVVVLALFMVAVVAAMALPAAETAAPAASQINWQVIASGGTTMSTDSGSYTMMSTTGQAVAGGPSSGGGYSLASGYWVQFQTVVRELLLPIILSAP